MMGLAKLFKYAHDVVLACAAVLVIAVCSAYYYEHSREAEHYLHYLAVVPAQQIVTNKQEMRYYSFALSRQALDTTWNDVLECDYGHGDGFEFVSSQSSSARQFKSRMGVALYQAVLDVKRTRVGERDDHVVAAQLRKLAHSNDKSVWIYNGDRPSVSALCRGVHHIVIETPIFNIRKYQRVESATFEYLIF